MKRILGWFLGFGGWGFWVKIGSVALGALGVLAAALAIRRNGRLAERVDAAHRRIKLDRQHEKDRKDVNSKIERLPVNSPKRNSMRERWTTRDRN